MGIIADISMRRSLAGGHAPNHRLTIGGEDATDNLIEARIVFESGGGEGGSGAQLTLSGSWADYDGAPVELHMGYGEHLVPYLIGELDEPQDDMRLPICEAQAFGPFLLLQKQSLRDDVNYRNQTVGYALQDVLGRAALFPGRADIAQELYSYTLSNDRATFAFGEPLSRVAQGILESADAVGADQPGGRRVFRRLPNLSATASATYTYGEESYFRDGFAVEPDSETGYHSVVAVRRDQQGRIISRAERLVGADLRFPPPRNRIYAIDNFEGSEAEMWREAEEIARYLRGGALTFSLTARPNYELMLYDTLEVHTRKNGADRRYLCLVDGRIEVNYRPAGRLSAGAASMTVTGRAIERGD